MVEKMMKALGISEKEALELIKSDKEIDRGADPFPQTQEQKKASKKYSQADREKAETVYQFSPREKKKDNDKKQLMEIISTSLAQYDILPDITNAEREMEFICNGRKFKLTLSAPRK